MLDFYVDGSMMTVLLVGALFLIFLFVKYVRVVNPNTYLTLGFSASFAQSGVNQLVNGQARTWTGWLANVVWVY